MANKYTESQKRASLKYQAGMAQMKITVTQEEKALIQSGADRRGISVKKYIMELVKADL